MYGLGIPGSAWQLQPICPNSAQTSISAATGRTAEAAQYNAVAQTHNRAVREAEYERAVAAAQRASAAEQGALDRAARAAHVDAQRAVAESKTAQALDAFEQIDSIPAATLDVDDYVDIESLKRSAKHRPCPREDLKKPIPEPKLEKPPNVDG